jgi:hypothetical protein
MSLAVDYDALFRAVYLRFHRRDSKRSELSGASRAFLMHLAQSGPLTVGECARHSEGKLQAFEDRFAKMVDWQLKRNAGAGRAQAEKDTLAFMAKMPAWKDNPELRRRLSR